MILIEMYKIYKITDNTNHKVYIGQTKQKLLSSRISGHVHDFKMGHPCSSQKILKNNDWKYELIEETDDKSREIYWINKFPNCINKVKYTYNYKEYEKEYNKNRIYNPDRSKQYYEKNKQEVKKRMKLYREQNKDLIKERQREYKLWKSKKRIKLICDWIDLLNEY